MSYGGSVYLVAWADARPGSADFNIFAARVTPSLGVLDPDGFLLDASDDINCPRTAFDGTKFFVVWQKRVRPHVYHIFGCFVYPDGTHDNPFPVGQAEVPLKYPSVAWNGSQYLVVWEDRTQGEIFGTRVSPSGVVLDPEALHISPIPNYISFNPNVASDGHRFLVVWGEWHESGLGVEVDGAFVEPDGSVGSAFNISEWLGYWPDVAFGDNHYLVVWQGQQRLGVWDDIFGRLLSTTGTPETDYFLVRESPAHQAWAAVTYGASRFLVAWMDKQSGEYDIRARYVYPTTGKVSSEMYICDDPQEQGWPSLASDGAHFLAAWADDELHPGSHGIYADTVGPWQDRFRSQSPLATAYNQGHSLAKDPETGILHMVYMSGDSVYYTYSTDGGEHWQWSEFVANGVHPCITCAPEGAGIPSRVWISYLSSSQHQIVCNARLGLGQWRTYVARLAADDDASWLGPPSMSAGYQIAPPIPFRGVYVTYAVSRAGAGTSIEYRAVDFDRGVVDQFVVDDVSLTTKRAPSIATTPGDVISVVWQRDDGVEQHTMYRNCYYGSWGSAIMVSFDPFRPNAEPAWEPCAEAYGDSAYVVWRGRSDAGTPDGDIWQRTVPIEPFPWPPYAPRNLSLTTGVVSDYPQNSLNAAVAYQEEWATWDLFGYIVGQNRTLVSDAAQSRYVDVTAEWQPDPAGLGLDAVWTSEEQSGLYEVKFLHRDYGPEDAPARNWCYDCGIGDTGKTRYCLLREGRAKWRDFQVDYGRQQLRYRLPFLNPSYIYKLRAVLFHASRDTWVNDFNLEGRRVARVAYRPMQPETIWVTIPRELYQHDCEVTLDIGRIAGAYAALAGLRLYQYSPYRQGGDEGAQSGSAVVPASSRYEVVGASLSRGGIALSYQVDAPEHANLCIYDARGAVVRELVSGLATLGRHVVRWDGTDAGGRRVPTGTYFCRLDRGKTSQVCKVVLTR